MMNRRAYTRSLSLLIALVLTGCATTVPYVGQGPHQQIERGRPFLPVDTLGNVLAVFSKVILWEWRFANHAISEDTESYVVDYLDDTPEHVNTTKIRLNQYAPHNDLKRLVTNKNVAWPYRLFIGLPVTLITEVLLPGRLFPWGDYYNPWTDTAHLYSDHPAIALHELGHSYDINRRRFSGTYAFVRFVPFVDLYQEYKATDEAIDYLIETNDRDEELRAYKILYPAYGTYVGGYTFLPGGSILGAVLGHIVGRAKAHRRANYYEEIAGDTTIEETN